MPLQKEVHAYCEEGKYIGSIPLNGDVAFNDLSAARRQSLLQEDSLKSAEFMVSQMGMLSKEDLKRLAVSEKSSDGLGGLVPGIAEMVPNMDIAFREEKRAVGHDASFGNQVDFSTDEVTASLVHLFGNKE